MPRKPSVHRLRWKLMHFKVLAATRAENADTLPKSVGVRSKEEQRSLNVRSVVKTSCTVLDTKLDIISQRVTERRMEQW